MNLIESVGDRIAETKQTLSEYIKHFDPAATALQIAKFPGAKVDREKFLRKELSPRHSKTTVERAVSHNPAYAGIERSEINRIAKSVIKYETRKVTTISFATGLPGGIAMLGTIPADIMQYFIFILRIMQELAYLYGFSDFDLNENEIPSETMDQILVFLGIMFGAQTANAGILVLADNASKVVTKRLANKALTKTTIYPIVKKLSLSIGLKMNKQIFASAVGKMIPIAGGFITGAVSYASFKPCATKLKESLAKLPLSDPKTYIEFWQ